MELPTFLSPERNWTPEQLEQAQFCVHCLKTRPERPGVQCAAQVNLGDYAPHARINCASIISAGGKMPEHGRTLPPCNS